MKSLGSVLQNVFVEVLLDKVHIDIRVLFLQIVQIEGVESLHQLATVESLLKLLADKFVLLDFS